MTRAKAHAISCLYLLGMTALTLIVVALVQGAR